MSLRKFVSTYYSFYCKAANIKGGFFGLQSASDPDTFKFLTYCIEEHGEGSISIVSENSKEYINALDVLSPSTKEEYDARLKFLEKTKDMFRRGSDWRDSEDPANEDVLYEEVDEFIKELEEEDKKFINLIKGMAENEES